MAFTSHKKAVFENSLDCAVLRGKWLVMAVPVWLGEH